MNPTRVQLETKRLILRPPVREDFDSYAAMYADEPVARWVGGVQSRAAAWRKFLTMVGAWHIQGFAMFTVIERTSGRSVGQLGPWHPEGWPGTEVGWVVAREFWGRGYACEGATVAIDWAFDHLDWSQVIHCIDPANTASSALAQRLGSRNRGPVTMPAPYENTRSDLWGQSREEWRKRRSEDMA